MLCAACATTVDDGWNASHLCPACHAISGAPLPSLTSAGSPIWLWTSPSASPALASGNLAVIIKAYRRTARITQSALATALGYDTTYISMLENGRRAITDVPTLRRVAQYMGLPPHVLGVTDPTDADFISMIKFGESTIRLASIARESGHSAEAINELWPLVWRLEARLADGHADRAAAQLLGQARAMLGVALGDVLPEESLASAARWTGRALLIAHRLDDVALLTRALRVHGNELRKIGKKPAAAARLQRASDIAPPSERGAVLIPLARTLAELGNAEYFDTTITDLQRFVDSHHGTPLVNPFVVREVHLRGLLATGRLQDATRLAGADTPDAAGVAPQWQTIERVTVAEVFRANGDEAAASHALLQSIATAESTRLPHQIQRAMRAARGALPEVEEAGAAALQRLYLTLPTA
ncbi:helix-turn-helix domain-containing protein [Nonomuraea rubra]|uniref:Transcriptional regulator with XRE-family HTH domain n=1 Tax=Nonomuraea rubra TaxID=46180 RepID=A0A7X0NNX5_9ACTN|nr:helix-turn-helix transcriptional regulator [Nonomuraea rubra]MBB6546881.1 transcriptional regulator with XRE-family HTH domain [Nonomuraea rubra]